MEEEKPPQKPIIALMITEEQAAILNTALGLYWLHLKDHPELQAALPAIEAMQRDLVEQSRTPTLHPTSAEGIKHLQMINHLILTSRGATYSSQERHERRMASVDATYLLKKYNIPIHVDAKTGLYRFGTYLGSDGE